MHLTVLIIRQWILLQTLIHDFIGDYHLIRTVCLNHKFQYIEQLTGIAARETEDCRCLTQFYITLFENGVCLYGAVQKLEQVILFQ